jgi:hypothetical protein
MADKRRSFVAAFTLVALMIFALHTYEEHQAYKTGIYMGKAFFRTEDYKNRECLRIRSDSFSGVCHVKNLNRDSVMEDALASAYIIPSLSDSKALHTGFRDGWREARTAAVGNR